MGIVERQVTVNAIAFDSGILYNSPLLVPFLLHHWNQGTGRGDFILAPPFLMEKSGSIFHKKIFWLFLMENSLRFRPAFLGG
jgi:hypothetical protein